MKTSRRPCYCQLEIGSCFCEWDDEDFSKMVKEDLVAFNTALSNQKNSHNTWAVTTVEDTEGSFTEFWKMWRDSDPNDIDLNINKNV